MTKWYKRTAVLLAVSMLSTSAGFTAMAEEPIVSAAEEEDIQISDDAAEEESSREGEQGSESDAESRAESPDGKEEEVTDSPDEKDTGADSQNPEVPEMLSENPDSTPGGKIMRRRKRTVRKKKMPTKR